MSRDEIDPIISQKFIAALTGPPQSPRQSMLYAEVPWVPNPSGDIELALGLPPQHIDPARLALKAISGRNS